MELTPFIAAKKGSQNLVALRHQTVLDIVARDEVGH